MKTYVLLMSTYNICLCIKKTRKYQHFLPMQKMTETYKSPAKFIPGKIASATIA